MSALAHFFEPDHIFFAIVTIIAGLLRRCVCDASANAGR
jgi:hypothetical protein